MKNMVQRLTLLILTLSSSALLMAQGKIVINEFMQSNMDFMMVDRDFPDSWVELYNGSGKVQSGVQGSS
jgi:hypothetical protein